MHPKTRKRRHFKDLEMCRHHNVYIQNDFNSGCSFKFEIVEEFDTISKMICEELYQISQALDDPLCYNIGIGAIGGDNLTRNPDRESIINRIKTAVNCNNKKLSADERKKLYGRSGKYNGMCGKKHADATKLIISNKNKGRRFKGRPKSAEHRHKMSINAKLRTGCKNPFFGKTHTEATKNKLRLANAGKLPVNALSVSIYGIVYRSITHAATCLGLAVTVVRWRVKSKNPKFKDWYFITECPECIESVPRTKKEQ